MARSLIGAKRQQTLQLPLLKILPRVKRETPDVKPNTSSRPNNDNVRSTPNKRCDNKTKVSLDTWAGLISKETKLSC